MKTAYHVGDGGYYDNSGLLSAVEWLDEACVGDGAGDAVGCKLICGDCYEADKEISRMAAPDGDEKKK